MATLKRRLYRKNSSGTYDTVYLETDASIITGTLPISHGGTGITANPSMLVNLGSASAASVFATSPRPGVTGTLPISHGGTGNTTGLAASATKLATARTIRTNLGSTSAASFNGTANITPGISGVLPVENGGTGVTNLNDLKDVVNSWQSLKTESIDMSVDKRYSSSSGTNIKAITVDSKAILRIKLIGTLSVQGSDTSGVSASTVFSLNIRNGNDNNVETIFSDSIATTNISDPNTYTKSINISWYTICAIPGADIPLELIAYRFSYGKFTGNMTLEYLF